MTILNIHAYLYTAYWFDTMNSIKLCHQGILIAANMLVITSKHPNQYLTSRLQEPQSPFVFEHVLISKPN